MGSSEAGGFGLGDCGGVEFAVGGVYDGFVVVYVEREMVDFFSGRSVYVALDHGVVAVTPPYSTFIFDIFLMTKVRSSLRR